MVSEHVLHESRSSKATRSCLRTNSALNLWLKSARCRATLDNWTASNLRALSLFFEASRVLEKFLCRRFSRSSAFLRNCGCGTRTPSEVEISDFNPRSTPTGHANLVSSFGASDLFIHQRGVPLAARLSDNNASLKLPWSGWQISVEDYFDVPSSRERASSEPRLSLQTRCTPEDR